MFQLPFRILRIFHIVTHQSGLIVRIYCENLVFVNRVPFDENTVNLLCRNKAAHSSVQLHFELNDNVFVYSRRVTSVITIHPEGNISLKNSSSSCWSCDKLSICCWWQLMKNRIHHLVVVNFLKQIRSLEDIKMFHRVQWKLTCWWWWWKSAGVTRIIRVHPLRTLISNVQSTPCLKRDFSLDGETLPPLHITACMRVYKTHSGCFHHFVALPRLHSVTWERVFIRSVCW